MLVLLREVKGAGAILGAGVGGPAFSELQGRAAGCTTVAYVLTNPAPPVYVSIP